MILEIFLALIIIALTFILGSINFYNEVIEIFEKGEWKNYPFDLRWSIDFLTVVVLMYMMPEQIRAYVFYYSLGFCYSYLFYRIPLLEGIISGRQKFFKDNEGGR